MGLVHSDGEGKVNEKHGMLQSGAAGFDSIKGEKPSNSQAACLAVATWVLIRLSPFPVSNPVAPPCREKLCKVPRLTFQDNARCGVVAG